MKILTKRLAAAKALNSGVTIATEGMRRMSTLFKAARRSAPAIMPRLNDCDVLSMWKPHVDVCANRAA